LAVVCLVAVMLSGTVQATHFCGFRKSNSQNALELGLASPGSPFCLICLMAPSTSALILLVAFFTLFRSTACTGSRQIHLSPIIHSFDLYIRPPPLY
jgi:hypothetical protein